MPNRLTSTWNIAFVLQYLNICRYFLNIYSLWVSRNNNIFHLCSTKYLFAKHFHSPAVYATPWTPSQVFKTTPAGASLLTISGCKYILQGHPLQFFTQTKCPFLPLDSGTALRHGCGQEEGASINAFPNPLHLLGPFLCQGQREFTKESEMLLLTSCHVVSDLPHGSHPNAAALGRHLMILWQALGRPPSCEATSQSKSAPVDLSQSPSAPTLI